MPAPSPREWTVSSRRCTPPRISRRAGRSNTSARHSRYVSTRIGKEPYRLATASRSAARWRCCQSGVRVPGRRRGQEQGPRRVLAEPAGEQARAADPPDDQVLDLVGIREQQLLHPVEARVALGQPDRDAVVGVDRLDLEAEPLLEPRLDRERPRGVHAAAERREHDEPPVPQLVAEPLDDDPPVGRQGAGGLALVLEVGEEVVGGEVVEVVVAPQALGGPRPPLRALREVGLDAAHELADRPAQLHRPPDGVAVPERQLARARPGPGSP